MSQEDLIQALQELHETGQMEGGLFSLVASTPEELGLLTADQQEMRHAAVLLGVAKAQREVPNAGLTEDKRSILAQDLTLFAQLCPAGSLGLPGRQAGP